MTGSTLTLLITRQLLAPGWFETIHKGLPNIERTHLFFLDHGTFLATADFSFLPPGKRIYCAHSLRTLNAPPPGTNVQRGGLFDLGTLLWESHTALSIPRTIWPHSSTQPLSDDQKRNGSKHIFIPLETEGARQIEGLRLATGLAGCNHTVTFCAASPIPPQADTNPYLETLKALGARFVKSNQPKPVDQHPGTIILQI